MGSTFSISYSLKASLKACLYYLHTYQFKIAVYCLSIAVNKTRFKLLIHTQQDFFKSSYATRFARECSRSPTPKTN